MFSATNPKGVHTLCDTSYSKQTWNFHFPTPDGGVQWQHRGQPVQLYKRKRQCSGHITQSIQAQKNLSCAGAKTSINFLTELELLCHHAVLSNHCC
jgi:hypothetical protein